MKAMVSERYGGPEVLELREVATPAPGEGEVLIKVAATCVNPADWHTMRASPALARLAMGLVRPKITILGTDAAGTVEAVGPGVTRFKPGDEVYADLYFGTSKGLGGFAEYAVAQEAKTARKPKNLSFAEAAAMPMAGITALQGLLLFGPIRPGATVLVNGASGGIGHLAVQIAKAMGAEVTGVTSTKNVDFVRSLGADHVIDYTKEDFTRSGKSWDLVADTIGNKSVADLRRALAPDGKASVIGFSTLGKLIGTGLFGGKNVKRLATLGSTKDLDALTELIEAGKLKPSIERTYPLAELPAAMRSSRPGMSGGRSWWRWGSEAGTVKPVIDRTYPLAETPAAFAASRNEARQGQDRGGGGVRQWRTP